MAIVFGLVNVIFFWKSDIFILVCSEGGESTGKGNIPKKNNFFEIFLKADLAFLDNIYSYPKAP